MKQRLLTAVNAFAVFAALLVLWQVVLWVFRVPPYMLPSPWAVAKAVGARLPSLLNALAITAEESGGRPGREHRRGRRCRPAFRAIPLGAKDVLSVHAAAADRADHRRRSADPHVGGSGRAGRDAHRVHHFARAHHREYHARPDQRGRKSGASLFDAQRFARHNCSSSCACRMPCRRFSWAFVSPAELR